MDWRGGRLTTFTEQIRDELAGEVVPRLFDLKARSNVILQSSVLQAKGLGATMDLADRSWTLYQLLSGASQALIASLATSLRRLTHTTTAKPNEDWGGSVRGQLNVSRTIMERAQKGGNPLFVAFDESVPSTDVPENLLLKLTLARMRGDIERLTHFRADSNVGTHLQLMHDAILPALRHPYLASLQSSGKATSQMLRASARSKVPAHYHAYQFWEQELRHKAGDQQAFLDVLSTAFVHPESEDDLFEFFVLTKTILALEGAASWQQILIGLPSETAIARFISENLVCTVYANTSPSEAFSWARRYKWKYNQVFQSYDGFDFRTRRPDILIEFATPGYPPIPMMIETKFSEDPVYIRDSIYKTLGYLSDFDELWKQHAEFFPRAILALASGMTPAADLNWQTASLQSPVAILSLSGGGINAMIDIFRSVLSSINGLDN